MYVQRKVRSACAFVQSVQNFHCETVWIDRDTQFFRADNEYSGYKQNIEKGKRVVAAWVLFSSCSAGWVEPYCFRLYFGRKGHFPLLRACFASRKRISCSKFQGRHTASIYILGTKDILCNFKCLFRVTEPPVLQKISAYPTIRDWCLIPCIGVYLFSNYL